MNQTRFLFVLLFMAIAISLAGADPVKRKAAIERFQKEHGREILVTVDQKTGTVALLTGSPGKTRAYGKDSEFAARAFLSDHRDLFDLPADWHSLELTVNAKMRGRKGFDSHVQFKQTYKGLKVFDSRLKLQMTSEGEIYDVENRIAPESILKQISTSPELPEKRAIEIAQAHYQQSSYSDFFGKQRKVPEATGSEIPEIGYFRNTTGEYRLVYRFAVGIRNYTIDAQNGQILKTYVIPLF